MKHYLNTLALGLILLTATQGFAKKNEFLYKGATVAPPNTPWSALLKKYKKDVRKASGKRIKAKVYVGGTKGDEQSIVRQVAKGTLQFGGVSMGAMAILVPELDIFELPYLFESFDEVDRVLDVVRPDVETLLEAKGFKLIMYSENGFRSFGTKQLIQSPADLKGVRMRAQPSQSHLAMYEALGANAKSISVAEVLPALNTGAVDGFDNTPLFTQAASWHQAITHYTVTAHIYQPALLIVNLDFYKSLPDELRPVLIPSDRSLETRGRKGIRALDPLLLKNLEAQKIVVTRLTDQQRDAFKKATRPSWDKRLSVASPAGKALFKAIQAAKTAAK
jgi:TRAP-type C4-dicarboxylate transport system substrate-binding protein